MNDNTFEKFPGEKPANTEAEIRANQWETAMNQDDVPAFAGDISMNQENPHQADASGDIPEENAESFDNEGLSDAASIINYGLNAAAKEYGVETVVQKIKSFDATGSENPIRDFFSYLGVDTSTEVDNVKMEREAGRFKEADFYDNSPAAPTTKKRSPEGAFKAIQDMKELISEVEGADPRYEQLREEARSAGKGYFEYAVGSEVNRDLTDLFNALAAEPKAEEPNLEASGPGALATPVTPENPLATTSTPNTPNPQDRKTLNPEIVS